MGLATPSRPFWSCQHGAAGGAWALGDVARYSRSTMRSVLQQSNEFASKLKNPPLQWLVIL